MSKLLPYMKRYTLSLVGILLLVYGQVMADLELPGYMAKIVNEGIVNKDTSVILYNGILMLLVTLGGAACAVAAGFLSSRTAAAFSRDLRERVFTTVQNFSLAEFSRFSTASLITRSTNDIQQIQIALVMIFRMVIAAPIMALGAVIKAYDMAPSMTWLIGLAVTVLFGMMLLVFTIAMPRFRLLQQLVDRINLVAREILTGVRVIRAFNAEAHEEEKFDRANLDLTRTSLFVNRVMVVMQPFMMLLLNFVSIGIVWVGAHLIGTGDLMVGNMIAFMQYAMQVIFSFLMLSLIFILVPRASVSAQRVIEVIETEPLIKDPENPVPFPEGVRGLVEFRDVTFAYPEADEPVLENISFVARPGEMVAVIGSTGSGKSTLINLIPRFYDVTSGSVLVDGVDVRHVSQRELRARIGYVPQRGVLFSGTVESNVRFGAPDAPEEVVREAIRIAQAEEFVERLEGGLRAPIAQGGTNVSGGQKQRLAIARALAKRPEIYIFDDSFSALDFRTDAALRRALREATRDATVIIVAQRIGTIIDADTIIVLEQGRIAGMGTHEELMETCEVYREIALSQLSEEELAEAVAAGTHRKDPA
jgi:ATP-binding cassette subfamily B multidrug efflux pump